MAYKRKTEGLDPERGNKMTLSDTDVFAVAALPPTICDAIMGAFVRWFAGGEDKPLGDICHNAILQMLKDKQRENVRHYIETCDNKGNGTGRVKSGQVGMSRDNPGELPNETKTKKELKPNETRRPGTACVSPSVFDSSVSTSPPDPAAVENAITTAAALLGDSKPSRDAWGAFIVRHGLAVFNEQVNAVLGKRGINNKGAYLNKALDAYTPPPPPPPPKPPKVYTPDDWQLCGERCANFNGKGCAVGVKIPPDHDPAHIKPPEQCDLFAALPVPAGTREPPALDLDTILKRTNARG